ncbi:hypothetical protein [Phaffia rhodozyma]|uniref:Uncharacterized protein n=1 Tax=Phaffia rhodozyma TaxID=264483 RepID=A0A0F7SN50_PHARH|nr:hypothetical protein [Phaffia rhodozyma]
MSSEEPIAKLWALVTELSDQLTQNRAVTSALQEQIAEVKNQAVHANTGFPLRRFNTDLTQEEYQSAIEEFSTKLVSENRTLAHENKQLSILLREYEATLEGVMGKFRGLAHSNQTHELELHKHYSTALMGLSHQQGVESLLESTQINSGLLKLGEMLRKLMRLENGELEDGGSAMSELPSSGGLLPPSYSLSARPLTDGSSAGRAVGETRLDWALEREAEIVRLEEENRVLRDLLGIGGSEGSEPPSEGSGVVAIGPLIDTKKDLKGR